MVAALLPPPAQAKIIRQPKDDGKRVARRTCWPNTPGAAGPPNLPSKIQTAAYHVINPRGKPTNEAPAVGPGGANLATGPRVGLYRMPMCEASSSGSLAAVQLISVLASLKSPAQTVLQGRTSSVISRWPPFCGSARDLRVGTSVIECASKKPSAPTTWPKSWKRRR